jgi:Putative Ig domain
MLLVRSWENCGRVGNCDLDEDRRFWGLPGECMKKVERVRRIFLLVVLSAFAMGTVACLAGLDNLGNEGTEAPQAAAPVREDHELVIETDSELPDTYPTGAYEIRLLAHGGTSALHWHLEKGALPAGIKLEDDGRLHGQAERVGEFQFTLAVTDGGRSRGVQKGFVLRVRSGLTLNWKTPAHVTGNRIDGMVEVSNVTPDDMDLTFDVKAVAEDGRATEIGYQHFVLSRGTTAKALPFGETLPHGAYVIYVNAVGEVAAKNLIHRERMQTPGPLQVVVGP